jgi:hypothetical protein
MFSHFFRFMALTICTLSFPFNDTLGDSAQLQIAPDDISDQWKLSWKSEASFLYFVEQSEDLSTWHWQRYYLTEEATTVDDLFTSTADRNFFRLQYTEFSSDNTSPLLTGDYDGDSISNYDEINSFSVLGLNALNPDSDDNGTNDGAEDSDTDSNTDAYEFANGRLVLTPDADVALYTDVMLGDDSYSGISAVPGRPGSNDGPKITVNSALAAAVSGDIILLQPGNYDESILNISDTGKILTLRPNGTVTLK